MPRFAILEVAIGIVFVYLILSLIVTTASEILAGLFRRRSRMLWKGVQSLLGEDEFAEQFYKHPMIRSLRRKELQLLHSWDPRPQRWRQVVRRAFRNTMPSYIPPRIFTLAILDTVASQLPPKKEQENPNPSRVEERIEQLRTVLKPNAKPDPTAGTSNDSTIPDDVIINLGILLEDADNDPKKFRDKVDTWFEESMERVSGWYKRWTQALVFALALILTVAANADTVRIGNSLWRDPSLRAALLERAKTAKPDTPVSELADVALPIGWASCVDEKPKEDKATEKEKSTCTPQRPQPWPGNLFSREGIGRWRAALWTHGFGWLITTVALTLGAPFWFDTLSRFVALRSAGKKEKPEKKQEKKETEEK